jgi:pyruvate/2-oxoacid:ferredoxin oxidoreductase beta subunit
MVPGNVYVARVAMGGSDTQTLRAFREAEAYPGTSIIIAFSHCIAHGYDLRHGMDQQKAAVLSGYWPLFRYNPERALEGRPALELDSKAPSMPLEKYAYNETRYTMLVHSDPTPRGGCWSRPRRTCSCAGDTTSGGPPCPGLPAGGAEMIDLATSYLGCPCRAR